MTRLSSRLALLALVAAIPFSAAGAQAPAADVAPPKLPAGYLAGQPPVDAMKLLPPPPSPNTPPAIADEAVYEASALGIGGAAWTAAQSELRPPDAAFMRTLACAAGIDLSRDKTPATMTLLFRALSDMVGPMDTAKNSYKRPRPFTTDNGQACDPLVAAGEGAKLGYSYPSGHSTLGWLMALVLSDAAPAKAGAIREWGRMVGEYRLVCRVHWMSDVAAGKALAVAVYDRIAATPAYKSDVAKAAAELSKAPPLTCPS